ncbi:DUF4232 domain-containing protein [Amycolatopsis sp. FU40]|uniref:DUF4232 domain-containing protein n=1 Tax=Amycolatopsis sp. FU40 TaxID=2914159 RepID=UPI001F2AABDF|nr:DUF4232 domain-containing protein [Amycolatopsis sp. FU40]UKD57515.1 DUF4232 domain-containing protein [Amycolatopsis sp. FU40]
MRSIDGISDDGRTTVISARYLMIGGVAAALAGTAWVPQPAARATAPCRTSGLDVALGQGEGAAGHYYVPIVFTNFGGDACALRGYPGVSYVVDRRQVGDAAKREPGPVPALTLAPGQSAAAWLDQVNVDVYDPASCAPTPVDGLRVYPPDNTKPVFLAEPNARACAKHMPDQHPLVVRAVQDGNG